MMKKTGFISILLIVLVLICSCKESQASDLRFYVIPRETLSDGMSNSEIIKAAKDDGRLVFDGEDIIGYNWQTHTVVLNQNAVTSISAVTAESGGSSLFKVDDSYAFVLVLGNKLIYTGGFANDSKNPGIPLQPSIKDETRYSFSINFDSKYATGKDSRQNDTLYKFLEYQGLLSSKTN